MGTSTLPVGNGSYTNTYDRDGNNNNQTLFYLDHDSTTGGDSVLDADFGYQLPTLIDGTIWEDWDHNGASSPDSGEDWLTNVTVTLYDSNGTTVATTTTDTDGNYLFTGLSPDNYVVVVDTSTITGTPTLTSDPDANGVPCTQTGALDCDSQTGVSLRAGQTFLGADFGRSLPRRSLWSRSPPQANATRSC